jgi:hypothetical protein
LHWEIRRIYLNVSLQEFLVVEGLAASFALPTSQIFMANHVLGQLVLVFVAAREPKSSDLQSTENFSLHLQFAANVALQEIGGLERFVGLDMVQKRPSTLKASRADMADVAHFLLNLPFLQQLPLLRSSQQIQRFEVRGRNGDIHEDFPAVTAQDTGKRWVDVFVMRRKAKKVPEHFGANDAHELAVLQMLRRRVVHEGEHVAVESFVEAQRAGEILLDDILGMLQALMDEKIEGIGEWRLAGTAFVLPETPVDREPALIFFLHRPVWIFLIVGHAMVADRGLSTAAELFEYFFA